MVGKTGDDRIVGTGEPDRNCPRCPRLAAYRDANRASHPDWHNGPVPSFGGSDAWLLIVGLAPGLRGANRTGRPFTGDGAGELLYATLLRFGLATGPYRAEADDGLKLRGCRITNAVRCVPPANRPTPQEIGQCRPFLASEMASLPRLRALLALGSIAHAAVLAACGHRPARFPFVHGQLHRLPDGPILTDSYHCSRLNTNTGRLTEAMFHAVFHELIAACDGSPGASADAVSRIRPDPAPAGGADGQ
ncbi:MAG: uracil-DNA glycosylase [Rhodospirillales bacterium]|nr:MAG: uracil-DNA glycosylase [Rhodospirillales bacterium]